MSPSSEVRGIQVKYELIQVRNELVKWGISYSNEVLDIQVSYELFEVV